MNHRLFSISLACILAPTVQAQEPPTTAPASRIYTAADFARYAPRTALEMVQQLPGFTISSDNDGSRGFGQASGNVLVNGQRISGKSNSANAVLARIPAENVEKIEIIDGATLDIPGLTGQVANVVFESTDGISGSWSWEARVREVVKPYLDRVEISASGKKENVEWTLGFKNNPGRGGATGFEDVFDAGGNLVEVREETANFTGVNPSISTTLNWTPATGNIGNLNASYAIFEGNDKEISQRRPTNGDPQVNRLFVGSEDEWNTEIGTDYEFGVGPGRLKLIGLYRFEHSPFSNRVFESTIDASSARETVFNQTVDESETIFRSEYSWAPADGRDWQISAEAAFNTLESESEFFEALDFAPLGENQLTGLAPRVEELRGEMLVTHGRQLTDKLAVQVSLGGEVSEISQSGPAESSQTFLRPKGFISTSYTVRDGYTLSGRVERKVGQLNFYDFIASSNINDGTGRDANPDLSPQQSWLAELEVEREFGDWGAGTVTLSAEEIEDIVDRIPLPGGGDGIGNLDSASRYILEFSGTLKLDPLGLSGVQIEADGNFEESSLTDPVTGEERRLNNGHIRSWSVDLRHDIPDTDWAWGVYVEDHYDGNVFFLDQISAYKETTPGFGLIYLEHKDVFGMKASVQVQNIFDRGDVAARRFFDGDRNGALIGRTQREREFGDFLRFKLSGSF